MTTCQESRCERPATRRGLCKPHYMRDWRLWHLAVNPPPPRPARERWLCVCGSREDFDGLQCRTCGRRPEWAMAESAAILGRPWPPEKVA